MVSLNLDLSLANQYKNSAQRIRVMSEKWVTNNLFCPRCGHGDLKNHVNNNPAADINCPMCNCDFELKSKSGSFQTKVVDGAYDSMIKRLVSNDCPSFLFLSYSKQFIVQDLLAIPGIFITPDIIQRRNPLSPSARRAGWVGCNILFGKLPEVARVEIIRNGVVLDKKSILSHWQSTAFLGKIEVRRRGWLLAVMHCIDLMRSLYFDLNDLYKFEEQLRLQYPNNLHIKAKIRQQLQLLRDAGYLEFLGNGQYKLSTHERK